MKNSSQNSTIRAQFPALAGEQSQPVCYLDNAATACTPRVVRDAICDFYDRAHGSVHRAIYASAEFTTTIHEATRVKVQHFLHAAHSEEIIFTSGATDSLNAVAHMWGYHNLEPGDGIVITQAEHHAHYVLWREVARRTGAILHVLPISTKNYCVDLSSLPELLSKNIKVIAVTVESNVLGPIWGAQRELLTELISAARRVDACVILDAAQVVAHESVDVQALDCDFLAFSAHKMGGPTGLGVLYARKALHEYMKPYRFGGGMVAAVSESYAEWQPAPQKFEAGTPPIAQVVGFGALLDFYREKVDFTSLAQHEALLCDQLITELARIPGVRIVGNTELLRSHGHLVTWYVEGIHAHDLAASLSEHGICVRAGDHCAQPITTLWNETATLRASVFMYNTAADIQHLVTTLKTVVEQWRGVL